MDPIRASGPQFGFDLNPLPLVRVKVPPQAAVSSGFVYGSTINRQANDYVVHLKKHEAVELLKNPVWCDLNPGLIEELEGVA
jgi:hypothetical protein